MSLHTGVTGTAYDCNYTSITEFVCKIEYHGRDETLQPYIEFCERAEGKLIRRSLEIAHNLLGMLSFSVNITGIPQCVGLSCDESTIEQDDLKNDIFDDFIQEMEVGDICQEENDPWGELDFWSNFGVQVAAWSGIDIRDCFSDPNDDSDDEDENKRNLRERGTL